MKIRREANTCIENPSPVKERNMNNSYEPVCQNGNFSSSLPETFSRKLDLSTHNFQLDKSIDTLASSNDKGSCFGTKGVTEEQGNLLPDENDLFSGIIDELIRNDNTIDNNGIEDFDFFRNTGGMELDVDQSSSDEVDRMVEGSYGSLEYLSTQFGLTKNLINGPTSLDTHKGNQVCHICVPKLYSCSFHDFHKGLTVKNAQNSTATKDIAVEVGAIGFMSMNKEHAFTMGNDTNQGVEFLKRVPVLSSNGLSPGELCGSKINNFYWHNRSSPLMWSNSGSLIDGNLRGHPHVGSAPPINCTDGFPESFPFCSGSFGNEGFLSHSSLNSCICSHDDGNYALMNGLYQTNQIFPNRIGFTSVPISFSSSSRYSKVFSHRRSQSRFSRAERKKFELDIGRVLSEDDKRTTLMIRNIPNRYNSKMLLAAIDEQCQGTYDFIYLPIDFKNNCNVGYAFINLIDPLHIIPFHKAFNGRKWEKFNSEKVVSLAYARIQGKTALIARFQNSSLMNEDKKCRPILFCTDGPNAGKQEPFAMGTTNIRKTGKVGRIITIGDDNQRAR
ncbi:protein MEI2-like 4 isoform X2 [Impatiens glandulifera]|nr:protein MEI2-like 4 isoform X2 [Impatiens glandulifera]